MASNPTSVEITRIYRERLGALRAAATSQVVRTWRAQVDPDNIDATFVPALDSMEAIIAIHQAEAARTADVYVAAYLSSELGEAVGAVGVDPTSFAGRTRDGRSVRSVLALGSVSMKLAALQGVSSALISRAGLARVARVSRTEVVDAARTAQASITRDNPRTNGWRRATSGDPCAACLGMAGAKFSDGVVFPLHGACSCIAEPIAVGASGAMPPRSGNDIVGAMSEEQRVSLYGEDRAAFIADGGDLSSLVATGEAYKWGAMLWEAPVSGLG